MDKKKIGIIVGTRPEMIKMAPVYGVLNTNKAFEVILVHSGQHDSLFEEASIGFRISPNISIRRKADKGNLNQYLSELILELDKIYQQSDFDMVLVHGDTLTSYAGAVCAFHQQIPIAHVEAGLRTYNKTAPFPEELYRQMVDRLADIHFAPTASAKECLINEKINPDQIHITGNTIVDALKDIMGRIEEYEFPQELKDLLGELGVQKKRVVLLTLHRREIQGQIMNDILEALKTFAERHKTHFICPVHPSPSVRNSFESILDGHSNFSLIDPLAYPQFVKLMMSCDLIISDSGGIQEEAPVVAKPVFVLREVTERSEGLTGGHSILCGTDPKNIIGELEKHISGEDRGLNKTSPYGDGQASQRIGMIIEKYLSV